MNRRLNKPNYAVVVAGVLLAVGFSPIGGIGIAVTGLVLHALRVGDEVFA